MSKNKTAALILILIVILSAAVIAVRGVLMSAGEKTAVIYQNGEIIREINLDEIREPIEFTIEGNGGQTNEVCAERGRIRIESASCPDKICVHQGWIENGVVPIVCLPNKITIEIRGAESADDNVDGITGV